VRDAELIQAIRAMPPGERSGRIRQALFDTFVQRPDIAQAIHRLAAAVERLPAVSAVYPPDPKMTSLAERMKDPAEKERIKASVLGVFKP
jgi:hypothetical protein